MASSTSILGRRIHSCLATSKPRHFHLSAAASLPRQRYFFTSNVFLSAANPQPSDTNAVRPANSPSAPTPLPKRKPLKGSLQRVAIIAQQPRTEAGAGPEGSMTVSAVCVAEAFHMPTVLEILTVQGFDIDPDRTGFEASEVVHARSFNSRDIFVFPSGTIVTWSLPHDVITKQLLRAAEDPYPPALREVEDLEYVTDSAREESAMKGDVVVLGTHKENRDGDKLATTLAKIAFSSGLARSTKVAVLETALKAAMESTKNIPEKMARGRGVPLTHRSIISATGQLLSLRARLNHYSELTDSLPEIFWDSRSSLGLENYYDRVGKALDVDMRIQTLNDRLDYAQEISAVLRDLSSQQHSTRLEWIIIALIAVEVFFELRKIDFSWLRWWAAETQGTESGAGESEVGGAGTS